MYIKKHKKIAVIVGVCILVFVGGAYAYSTFGGTDSRTSDRTQTKTAPKKQAKEVAPVAESPKPAKQGAMTSCEKLSTGALKSVLGSSYVQKVSNAAEPLASSIKVCEYTAGAKKAKVIVHDFGNERIAQVSQKDFKGMSVEVKGSVVFAVAISDKDLYQKEQSEKLLRQVSEGN